MAKYFDKKLYYKNHYHNNMAFMESTGRIIWDPDEQTYIVEHRRHLMDHFAAIVNNKVNVWHRKRKSKYAVYYPCPYSTYYLNGLYTCYLNKKTIALIRYFNDYHRIRYIGVVNGYAYFEMFGSAKHDGDTNTRYLAKSKDGLLIETVAPFITNTDISADVPVKPYQPYKTLILQDETYTQEHGIGYVTSSSIKYFKVNTQNDTISYINVSNKLQSGEIITAFAFPFLLVYDGTTYKGKIKSSGKEYDVKINTRNRGNKIYLIKEDDTLVDVTFSLKPNMYTYAYWHYNTYYFVYNVFDANNSSPSIVNLLRTLITFQFNLSGVDSPNMKESTTLGYSVESVDSIKSLYNGNKCIISLEYGLILDNPVGKMLYDSNVGWIDVSAPFENYVESIHGSPYINTSYISLDTNEHMFMVDKYGNSEIIKFFENKSSLINYNGSFQFIFADSEYFYFINRRYLQSTATYIVFKIKETDVETFYINTISGSDFGFELYPYDDTTTPYVFIKTFNGSMQFPIPSRFYETPIFENGVFKELKPLYYLYYYNESEQLSYVSVFMLDSIEFYNNSGGVRLKGLFDTVQADPNSNSVHPWVLTHTSNVPNQTFENIDVFYNEIE